MNIDLLRRLCETPGIPGREQRVRGVIEKEIKGLFDEVRTDAMGSLIAVRKPTSTRKSRTPTKVLMAAHMDEIGFFVRDVDAKGCVWLNPAGGFDTRNLFSRRVKVCTSKGDYPGVMNPGGKPIHISSDAERSKVPGVDEFFIDLGMEAKEVAKRVSIGDFVVMDEPFIEMPRKVVSKALDNRFACWCAIEAIRKIDRAKARGRHAAELVVAFTVQEEVGLRGAQTAANGVGADIGVGIDVTLACDTPGIPDHQRVTRHGEGAAVLIQDSSMIADAGLVEDLCSVARRHRIAHQRSILPRGGQDGGAIQRSGRGARAVGLCCGTRYIHTVTEMIDKDDLGACVDLLAAWLPTID